MKDLHVLVCDDSELVRAQMKETLEAIGVINIMEACNGEEAINICKENKPQLVFMDIIMPKKDGIAALKEIHKHNPNIKVIMASSTTSQSHLKKSLLLGAYSFIQKPISETVIQDILTKFLSSKPNECSEN